MTTTSTARSDDTPEIITLPDGFRPESVVVGHAHEAFFGSLGDGQILGIDLRTGIRRVVSEPGGQAGGLALDELERLFVAGGFGGDARVVDSRSGEVLAVYPLADRFPSVVADVTLTPDSVWFTDSFQPYLYRVPRSGNQLAGPEEVERVPVTGDFVQTEGFNLSGITVAPDGSGLLVVQASTGRLFHVALDDLADGARAVEVDLDGGALPSADGLLRLGDVLWVALGQENAVAAVRLSPDGRSGRILERIDRPDLDVPTALATYGDRVYVVNSRLTTEPTPTTPYAVVSLPRPKKGSPVSETTTDHSTTSIESVLDPSRLFHTGLVVENLDKAMDTLTRLAGYRWTTVMELDVAARTPDGVQRGSQRFVLSHDEPRLELVEEMPGTVWVSNGSNGAHHVGYWAEDIVGTSAALVDFGFEVEAASDTEDGAPLLWVYHRGLGGIRIELLSTLMKPSMDAWLAGVDPSTLAGGPS